MYKRQAAPHVVPEPKPKPKPAPAPEPKPKPKPAPASEPKPKPQPAPAPGPFQHDASHGGAAPPPQPKHRSREHPHEREKRRQEQYQRPRRRAPVKPSTEEEERAHDQKNIDAAVSNNGQTSEMRKQLAQRNRDRKVAREAKLNESRAGKVPSSSANIPDPSAAAPADRGEHTHHHKGHTKMHDDNFATGL